MPLYNNILLSRTTKDDAKGPEVKKSSTNAASLKFLQDHLKSKRRLQQQSSIQPSKIQKTSNARSQNLNSSQIISESILHKHSENEWNLEDEYDPMIPNNYEVLKTEYLKNEEARLAERKSAPTTKRLPLPNLLEVLDRYDEIDGTPEQSDMKVSGTSIAPPPSLLSKPSFVANDEIEGDTVAKPNFLPKISSKNQVEKLDASTSVAAKIMSKMGYKQGSGLGKDEQGISSPLEVEKSGLNVGRIMANVKTNQAVDNKDQEQKIQVQDDGSIELLRNSTCVLLLQNMVGPGEVDDDLEAETKEECKKYGEVIKCLIYEIPNKRVADSEAVRIFVEFRQVESAIKAASDLNGRYFGGRIVKASFYSVERFHKYDLGS